MTKELSKLSETKVILGLLEVGAAALNESKGGGSILGSLLEESKRLRDVLAWIAQGPLIEFECRTVANLRPAEYHCATCFGAEAVRRAKAALDTKR